MFLNSVKSSFEDSLLIHNVGQTMIMLLTGCNKVLNPQKAKHGTARHQCSITDNVGRLGKFTALWGKIHNMHPSKDVGIQILDHISNSALASEIKPQKIELEYSPTGAEIFEDVRTHNKFFNHLNGEFHPKFSWIDFWMGWGAMGDNGNPLMESHTPLVAFDVVAHPGKGLSKCVHSKPDVLERKDVCMRVHKDGCPLLYSVVTPGATITCPHCDNTGSGHIILLTYGKKLEL
jgi:hypothetical protein